MRLQSVKLAGFKSFSRPIALNFPSDRVGLVGPNGCGKSNIIDAIRWVLGESSASGLRGDSLGDVIFNGSENEPPAGRASVEMVFAGDLKQLGAKHAKQKSIRIRRTLERERDSKYYIDNTACRRMDIAGLFAGMGLTGKADYAIVTQGSVHNIAESKPEHIRSLLEEAADITHYLQKRKETLARIKTTRVNLKQATLVKQDSERRMRELQRQAEDAKRVTELRDQLKEAREMLTVARYADLIEKRQSKEAEEERALQKINARKDEQAHLLGEKQKLQLELRQTDATITEWTQSFNEMTHNVGSGESRLEILRGQLPERDKESKDLHEEAQRLRANIETEKKELETALAERDKIRTELERGVKPAADGSNLRAEEGRAEERLGELNQLWEEVAGDTVRAETERARCRREQEEMTARLQRLDETPKRIIVAEQKTETDLAEKQLTTAGRRTAEIREALAGLEERLVVAGRTYEAVRAESEKGARELAGIEAATKALAARLHTRSGGKSSGELNASAPSAPRHALFLKDADTVRVRPGWEKALDLVASRLLNAYKTDDLDKTLRSFAEETTVSFALIEVAAAGGTTRAAAKKARQTAADLVHRGMVPSLLRYVYTCENLEQAIGLRSRLKDYESVLTSRGDWLGNNWAFLTGSEESSRSESGFLAEQKELRDLKAKRLRILRQSERQKKEAEATRAERDRLQQKQRELRAELDRETRLFAELTEKRGRLRQQEARREEQLRLESEERNRQREERTDLKECLRRLKTELGELSRRQERLTKRRDALAEERESMNQRQASRRQRRDAEAEQATKLRQGVFSQTERVNFLQKNIRQETQRMEKQETTAAALAEKLTAETAEAGRIESDTEKKRSDRTELEERLNAMRSAREKITEKIEATQNRLSKLERETALLQRDMEDARSLGKQLNLQLTDLMDQNTRLTSSALAAKSKQAPGGNLTELKFRTKQLQSQLDRMGDVNQLALRDYETEKERLEKIRTETQQINAALKDLERAIKRIDKESRRRFEDTLGRVNKNFGALFAGLSDGGKAHLAEEKYEDEHKTPGIRIMVIPPGRRRTSVSLLSGGEKSLVAIAFDTRNFSTQPGSFLPDGRSGCDVGRRECDAF